ncbi:MAG: 30S ribosomal protein S17e [Candidatus Pacearchaeota archaeon]
MGKIKSKLVKRTSKILIEKGIEFHKEFEANKKILGNTMPSKKLRNQMAGYLSRVKKQDEEKQLKLQNIGKPILKNKNIDKSEKKDDRRRNETR